MGNIRNGFIIIEMRNNHQIFKTKYCVYHPDNMKYCLIEPLIKEEALKFCDTESASEWKNKLNL